VRQRCLGDCSRTFLFCKQLFLGWMKLRNVGEVSQLKYSSDYAPLATPATLIRKSGPTLSALLFQWCLFVKHRMCSSEMVWARGWL
jgi:hypothetical protein